MYSYILINRNDNIPHKQFWLVKIPLLDSYNFILTNNLVWDILLYHIIMMFLWLIMTNHNCAWKKQ